MLAEKIREHDARVWLVNTGWSGGPYGVGERFSLKYTRAIVDAIHAGQLGDAPVQRDVRFGFYVLTACSGVSAEPMVPKQVWADALAYLVIDCC